MNTNADGFYIGRNITKKNIQKYKFIALTQPMFLL